jgi:hypothetical protein
MNFEKLIITAASEVYASSLLALLGSLNLNWPEHPPVLVYDIGLDEATLTILNAHNILVKKFPPFVHTGVSTLLGKSGVSMMHQQSRYYG